MRLILVPTETESTLVALGRLLGDMSVAAQRDEGIDACGTAGGQPVAEQRGYHQHARDER
jgi:hypothetical protein